MSHSTKMKEESSTVQSCKNSLEKDFDTFYYVAK